MASSGTGRGEGKICCMGFEVVWLGSAGGSSCVLLLRISVIRHTVHLSKNRLSFVFTRKVFRFLLVGEAHLIPTANQMARWRLRVFYFEQSRCACLSCGLEKKL